MREADLHLPQEAIETLGCCICDEGSREADVTDVTMVSSEGTESVFSITYERPVDDGLAGAEAIEWWERFDRSGPGVTYLCQVDLPDLGTEVARLDRHVEIQSVTPEEEGCTITVIGSQDALGRLIDRETVDVPVSLRRVTDYQGPDHELDSLTDRQRQVLEAAHDLGYFEVPREVTAAEIAGHLDLDRSTVTEHLQRAERNLISAVLSS